MTCHVALRVGEFEHRLRREGGQAWRAGAVGVCEACAQPIPIPLPRLPALPGDSLCVTCKAMTERLPSANGAS